MTGSPLTALIDRLEEQEQGLMRRAEMIRQARYDLAEQLQQERRCRSAESSWR